MYKWVAPHCLVCRAEEVSYKRVVELRSLIADKDLQPQLCVGEPSIKGALRRSLAWQCNAC